MKPMESDDLDDLVGKVVEEYLQHVERGEEPCIDKFVERYPEVKDIVETILPSLPTTQNCDSQDRFAKRQLGDFRILRQIGRGGMGIVYEAEQLSMNRKVALKVLPLAGLVEERTIRRFQNEVRAVAALNHPNIVPVFMVGEEHGTHYYAMQLIRSRSLSEIVASLRKERNEIKWDDRSSPDQMPKTDGTTDVAQTSDIDLTGDGHQVVAEMRETVAQADGSTIPHSTTREYCRNVAALGIQAATAIQHAHDEGIIHRDIKPANLLIDHSSKLYLTDFGLARIESHVGVTMTGDVVGTLRYMAPEQALAKPLMVDHRADIYSLGVTLYELLTLRPAYSAEDRQLLLKQIAFEDPTPVRHINKDIPIELETIIHKAISKEVDQRYPSASELAEDLRSFLESRPIKAKPPTLSEIVGKWTRRNPAVFGAAVLIGAILLVTSIVSSTLAVRLSNEKQRASQSEQKATDEAKRNRRLRYFSDVYLAHQLYKKPGDLARSTQLLLRSMPADGEDDLRGFEWFYLWNVCRADHSVRVLPRMGLSEVAFSSDNRTFATGGSDGIVQIWDRRTLERIGKPWRVDPAPESQVRRMDVLYSPQDNILAGLFHKGFLGVKGQVLLFDVATDASRSPRSLAHESEEVISVGFRDDGTLVTAESDGFVRFWNASTGQPAGQPRRVAAGEKWERAAFSSDFQLVAAGGKRRPSAAGELPAAEFKVYRIDTGSIEAEIEADNCSLGKLQFSVDDRYLINPGNQPGGKARLMVWDVATGEEVFSHPGRIGEKNYGGVALIPPNLVAVGGSDSILFVNPTKAEIVDRWQGVPGAVVDLALSPDRRQLASTGWDGAMRLWDIPREENPMSFDVETKANEVSFSPSGDALVSSHEGHVIIRGAESFQTMHRLNGESGPVFSPSGELLSTISESGSAIRFWNYLSGRRSKPPVVLKGHRIARLAFSTDGKWMACMTDSGAVFAWEVAAPENRKQFQIARSVYRYAHYLALGENDGGQHLMAIPESNRTVKLINLETDEQQILRASMTTLINDAAFAPNQSTFVACGNDICVWNTGTGVLEQSIEEISGAIKQVTFSPDGTSIITRGYKGEVSLWDVQSGWEKMRLLEQWDQTPHSVAFSPDGNRIVASIDDGTLMVWSAPPVDSSKGIGRQEPLSR